MTWKVKNGRKFEKKLLFNFSSTQSFKFHGHLAQWPLTPLVPRWCSRDSSAITKYLDFTYSVLNGWTVCIITRTRQHGKMCKTNHSICVRISVIIALHTLQKYRNQDFIGVTWIMGVTWVCRKRLKTWQWFCLSQSYSNLTYLCLSSVKASKRSLYIFRAFSPSTSHIFNQDLTLKKHQC